MDEKLRLETLRNHIDEAYKLAHELADHYADNESIMRRISPVYQDLESAGYNLELAEKRIYQHKPAS